MPENLLFKTNSAITEKKWGAGLSYYTQANCQITLTDNGFRIYRPPNLTVSANGSTMWGGLKVIPYSENNADALIKGHTYIIKFHVKGKSSNAVSSTGFTNLMGWTGGGLSPSPSNVSMNYPKANFNGEMECFYKFTMNDDYYKTCTSSYSSFVAGQSYISYAHFMCGFGYTDTGSMGTDLYITNLRMYDLTSGSKIGINKAGTVMASPYEHDSFTYANLDNANEVCAKNIIEF